MVLYRKERIRKHGRRELVSEGKAVSYTKECSGFFSKALSHNVNCAISWYDNAFLTRPSL